MKRTKSIMAAATAIVLIVLSLGVNPSIAIAQDADKIHTVVDEMPEIKGGLSALYEEIEYPKKAVRSNISGRVYLQVIVDENGQPRNPKVIRDIGGGCGEAAAEAITKVDFKPGKQDGEAVKVKYSLAVTFRIDG